MAEGKLRLSPNALTILEKRYLRKDEQGRVVETPEEMFKRVAHNIAQADANYAPAADVRRTEEEFLEVMTDLEFLPNSPTLMNAGTELQQLSACFVVPIEDSMESIFEALKAAALIHKSGGGTGFSFSRLRPKNDIVKSTGGVASGPVSFMAVFDAATEAVKQGGRRRGANMGILRVDHPDIVEFIRCKEKPGRFENFNISVAVTEQFMRAVENDDYYDLINPRTGQAVGRMRAREVFDLIAEMAWKTGDPGLIFLDRINEDNPTPHIGRIESTNPCGEQPLLPWESCNLGSINLSKMVRDGEVDWERLRRVVRVAVHFLDNVIDMNKYPLPEIERMTKANRKIGLGVMGFADMLIKLGIPYDSEEALELAERLMRFIREEGRKMSAELAEQRGVFPNWRGSIYDRPGGIRLRNATITTIAPTGTISIIAGCSSGIEPLFAIAYKRRVLDGELREVHPEFERIARREGFWSESLMEEIEGRLSIQDIEEIPKHIRRLFLTAYDIPPEWHVRMQAAFQKYTDNAVSKTINMPPDATVDDVKRAFMLAWRLRCKGITVFRYGSKRGVIEVVKEEAEGRAEAVPEEGLKVKRGELSPRPRPQIVKGKTIRMRTGCGNLYVTVNEDEQGLFEVFASMGKTGGCVASFTEAIARLISLALRSGIKVDEILEQLRGIRCPMPRWDNGAVIRSCADAIAKAIEIYLGRDIREHGGAPSPAEPSGEASRKQLATMVGLSPQCPECGGMLEVVEGCIVCRSCGYTRCE